MRSLPLLLVFLASLAQAADYPLDAPAPDGRRPGGTISQELPAPPLANDENKDIKRERNYPEQPPTIPHAIRGYQVDKNGNKCLTCHSRAGSAKTQAPMISITRENRIVPLMFGSVMRKNCCLRLSPSMDAAS